MPTMWPVNVRHLIHPWHELHAALQPAGVLAHADVPVVAHREASHLHRPVRDQQHDEDAEPKGYWSRARIHAAVLVKAVPGAESRVSAAVSDLSRFQRTSIGIPRPFGI